MSLKPQSAASVPQQTAHVAHAAFPKGNPYLTLRDEFGVIFSDEDFAELYSDVGQPAYSPWRLALITLVQFRENRSDRQAAEAVRARIDLKYLLGLDLEDAGFDGSVLSEFRGRLVEGGTEEKLLEKVLCACRERGLLKKRGRQRTDSTHVLAAVRELSRIELVSETLRAALNALAAAAPDWLRALAPPEWYKRYGRRIEEFNLPCSKAKRAAYAQQVGEDGFALLDALAGLDAPDELSDLSEVKVLRAVWQQNYERSVPSADEAPDSSQKALPPHVRHKVEREMPRSTERLKSPFDPDARYRRKKSGLRWTGYYAHLTETCDENRPRLFTNVDTTDAAVHEARRTTIIHAALSEKGRAPAEHLVDAAYVSASHLASAQRLGIHLVGPARPNPSRQAGGRFAKDQFEIEWTREEVRCPEGKTSMSWRTYKNAKGGRYVKARFASTDCRACPSRQLCTPKGKQGRQLSFHPREEHEALEANRARQKTKEGRRLRALRRGVEGTISQGVRSFGLRKARYRGQPKVHLENVAIAAAMNLDRAAAWLEGRPLAATRTSRFLRLAA